MNRFIFIFLVLLLIFFNTVRADEIQNNNQPLSILLKEGAPTLISILDFLESNGYCLSKKIPGFFFQEAYNMVYTEINKVGHIGYSFVENGIWYHLEYALNMPDDPNYFVYATFIFDKVRYWLYKVNFFLEYEVEKEWIEADGSVKILKMFY